ncbi:MAG: site-specific DNA-methyltransferase [Desulfatiglandales bacterium]
MTAAPSTLLRASFQDQILYQGDSLREWQQVPDQTVDLILTDPPYGAITRGQPWDVRPDFHVLGWIFDKLLKPAGQVAIFCDFQTASEIDAGFSRYFTFRFNWIWQKPSVIPINSNQPANDIELILVYKPKGAKTGEVTFNLQEIEEAGEPYLRPAGKTQNRNPTRGNGGNLPEVFVNKSGQRFPRSVLRFPNKPCMPKSERTAHPTQKPLGLLEYILKALTNPGDMVLDSFAGSGSTLVACHHLNRRGIGFELCPEYFEIAQARLQRETRQFAVV